MESNTLPTENELIAQFMGFERIEVGYTGTDSETQWQREHREWMDEVMMDSVGIYYVNVPENKYEWEDDIAYDTSWDWLMPVVEKIALIVYESWEDSNGYKNITHHERAYLRTFGMIDNEGRWMVRINRMPLEQEETLILATYKAVVEFIKWYNQQPKP